MTDDDALALTTFLGLLATFSFAVTYLLREDRTTSKAAFSPVVGIALSQRRDKRWVKRRYLLSAIGASVIALATLWPLWLLWEERDPTAPLSVRKVLLVLACTYWYVVAVRMWNMYGRYRV